MLLIYVFVFACVAFFNGTHMWFAHPDLVDRHFVLGAASIWLTEQLRRLAAFPVSKTHRLRHCTYRGKAVKPTRLFAIRIPALIRQFAHWAHPVAPRYALIGKHPNSSWKTFQKPDTLRSSLIFNGDRLRVALEKFFFQCLSPLKGSIRTLFIGFFKRTIGDG